MSIFKALRTIVRVIGFVDCALDEFQRELKHDEEKKAADRRKQSEIYQKASNGPFKKE